MFAYLPNQLDINTSLAPQRQLGATAYNGSAIDISVYQGPLLVKVNAPATTVGTVTFTVEESADGSSSWAAIDAADLIDPDTGAASTFTVATTAVANDETLAIRRENVKRYLRVVATTAGGSVDVVFSGHIAGLKQYA